MPILLDVGNVLALSLVPLTVTSTFLGLIIVSPRIISHAYSRVKVVPIYWDA